MQFLGNKWFVYGLFLSLATNAFSQSPSPTQTITIKGRIENPSTSKVHFSSVIRCNSVNGCQKFLVNTEDDFKDYPANNRDIIVSKHHQPFVLSNIKIKKDKQLFFFFDSLGRAAKVLITKSSEDKRIINVGNIILQPTHQVTGKILFPKMISNLFQQKTQISFSQTDEKNDMYLVGFSQLNETKSFNLRLLPGKYTIFFDVPDEDDNWRRVIKTIEVSESNIDLGSVSLATSLDDLVTNKTNLTQIFKIFSLKELNENEISTLQEIQDSSHGVALVYFFAGYCSPCLGKDGLSKYLKLTHEFPENFAVIGIHSDSYRMTKNCPTSQVEMMDFVQNKWKMINDGFQEAQGNKVLLSFQPATFAESLSINGYPTTMIFKDGILQKWFVGVNPKTEETIRNLLKK